MEQAHRCNDCNEVFWSAAMMMGTKVCTTCKNTRKRKAGSMFSTTRQLHDRPPVTSASEVERVQVPIPNEESEVGDEERRGGKDEGFVCMLCDESLPHLQTELEQTSHLNSCLTRLERKAALMTQVLSGTPLSQPCLAEADQVIGTGVDEDIHGDEPVSGKLLVEPTESALRDAVFHCVVCHIDLSRRALLARCCHLKSCAKQNGVGTKELLEQIAPIQEFIGDGDEGEEDEDQKGGDRERDGTDQMHAIVIDISEEDCTGDDIVFIDQSSPAAAPPKAPAKNAFTVLMNRAAAGSLPPAAGAKAPRASISSSSSSSSSTSANQPNQPFSHPTRAAVLYIPPHKKLIIGSMTRPILIDAFQYASDACECYFLTHFHSDHYIGLDKSFDYGTIYCTSTTAGLVRQRLKPQGQMVVFDLDVEYQLTVGGQPVLVTFMDANHCPGSCCILFSFPENRRRVLHTGDFRFEAKEMLRRSPTWRALLPATSAATEAGHSRQQSDLVVYLDTTYLDPKHCFPSQATAVSAVCSTVTREIGSQLPLTHLSPLALKSKGILFVFGAYQIGKERVYMSVSEMFDPAAKICVDKHRQKGMLNYAWPMETLALLTTSPDKAFIHVVPMNHLTFPHLQALLGKNGQFQRLVAFQPTGWVHTGRGTGKPSGAANDSDAPLVLPVRERGPVRIYSVPYSEHSSFSELCEFVTLLRPAHIVPTVNARDKNQVSILLKHTGTDLPLASSSTRRNEF